MNVIKGTIDRFEEGRAVIRTANGETIIWPKILLEENSKEGDAVNLIAWPDSSESDAKKQLAQEILNKSLGDSR